MKKIIASLVGVLLIGIFFAYSTSLSTEPESETDLNRPLVVGVVSWPGYAAGIAANRGFDPNEESIFTKQYGLPVRFVLIEDIAARGKAFAKGGPQGVDVMWTTVDFWANELPGFIDGGIHPKAFFQVDWSRGGDAIVADASIERVEDLVGKKIALIEYTPSHWMLESALRASSLSELQMQQVRDNLIFTQDTTTARAAFLAGAVDATVVWEPDVKQALKREGAHVLISTNEMQDIIADVMVAKQSFIDEYPEALEAFVRGWLDGVEEVRKKPDLAAQYLVENEPLFEDLGFDETLQSLDWVYWPDLADNVRMFGLDGTRGTFHTLFSEASSVWKSLGLIDESIPSEDALDISILERVYTNT